MRKFWTASALAAFSLIGAVDVAPAQPVDTFGRHVLDFSRFYFTAGAVIMKRSAPDNQPLVASFPPGTTYMRGTDLKFGWDTGFEGTIGLRLSPRHAVEVRHININSNAAHSFDAPANSIGLGFRGFATRYDTSYETKFRNWEVNGRYTWSDRISLLAGFRAINLKDGLLTSISALANSPTLFSYGNEMRGAQIGVDWAILPRDGPLQINLYGKLGVLHNNGSGSYEYSGLLGRETVSFKGDGTGTVRVLEGGVSLGYRLNNNVVLRAGYQVLSLNTVALASNNVTRSATLVNLVDVVSYELHKGSLLYHGANFSVTINW